MNRIELIKKAYDASEILTTKNSDYLTNMRLFTFEAIKQDLGDKGDITTSMLIGQDKTRKAIIKSKSNGVVAGIEEAIWFYKQFEIEARALIKDGDKINPGDKIMILKGRESDLLKTERTGLNLLQRMSGVATLTSQISEKARPVLIAGTRKTHWGLLDNKAVYVGGGLTHRLGLNDAILIKENHLEALKEETKEDVIKEAIMRARKCGKECRFIEIEVQNGGEAIKAAKAFSGCDNESIPKIIMLDNFSPEEVSSSVSALKNEGLYENVLIEASGGINADNISDYKNTGVDIISIGFLTHSPKSLDISQLIIRN